MEAQSPILLKRDVEAVMVPAGNKVKLIKGEMAKITQSLGGSFTVVVGGNMFCIAGTDADALGLEPLPAPPAAPAKAPATVEDLERQLWEAMRTCYDPEIPVNLVDLGLIYDCQVVALEGGGRRADIKMTLTAPGCGMGPMIAHDVRQKVLSVDGITEAGVELVWEPPWSQDMMSEAAKLQLGML